VPSTRTIEVANGQRNAGGGGDRLHATNGNGAAKDGKQSNLVEHAAQH
jgi:hypothetical protein